MRMMLQAVETLFFKDGRPFNKGEDSWADTVFPPYPSVLYGALRTALLYQKGIDIQRADTEDDPGRKLVINAIYYGINDSLFFPVPLDCVAKKNVRENIMEPLNLAINVISNCPLKNVLQADSRVTPIKSGLFDYFALSDYLAPGVYREMPFCSFDDFIRHEPKTGIARNRNTKAIKEEGGLYRVDMIRPENEKKEKINILVDYEGVEYDDEGFVRLGGEGKVARYHVIDKKQIIKEPELQDNRFKLYISTPALFKGGWLPGWLNTDNYEGELGGLRLRLLAAAVDKPFFIGGFDYKNKRPKTMRKAVPQGSVYYFEVLKGTVKEIINLFHGKSISDYEANKGFGICYVGGL